MSDLAWAVKNGDMDQVKELVEGKVATFALLLKVQGNHLFSLFFGCARLVLFSFGDVQGSHSIFHFHSTFMNALLDINITPVKLGSRCQRCNRWTSSSALCE